MNLIRKPTDTNQENYYIASQWRLMWYKFKHHKLAMVTLVLLVLLYLVAIFSEFVSPFRPGERFEGSIHAPPNGIHFFTTRGGFKLQPFVYGLRKERDPRTFRYLYEQDKESTYRVYFFARGSDYKLWGIIPLDLHLFGAQDDAPMFLFGTDNLGRDLFSRTIHASRISLSIGLLGVFVSTFLGLLLGGLAGYLGGVVDSIIMRSVDLLASIPGIPLWMTLAAAVPRRWSVITTYFAITVILSLLGWTHLARAIRGKFLSLREEDFVVAGIIAGAPQMSIIFRHLLPSFLSYVVVSLTLAIPGMILGETALSFLGLGIQPPAVSWGTLLQAAQHFQVVAHHSWLLVPCIFVVITVLMFNFLGDGLRDASDPYR